MLWYIGQLWWRLENPRMCALLKHILLGPWYLHIHLHPLSHMIARMFRILFVKGGRLKTYIMKPCLRQVGLSNVSMSLKQPSPHLVILNFKDKTGYKTICVPRNQLHTYGDKLKENTKHSALLHHEYLIHYIMISKSSNGIIKDNFMAPPQPQGRSTG